jgi:AcrR family transcriptional regulator
MSGKTPASSSRAKRSGVPRGRDPRVRRTRDALGDALVELMHQRPFGAITVQHVLDRAHVARSTFYAHYRGKDDLFLSDVDEFFEGMATLLLRRREASERVAPVRELLAHVAEWREFHAALITSGKLRDVWELGEGHFARAIDRRLAALPAGASLLPARRRALSHALAGALLSLLSWWIDHGAAGSPAEMDDLYHRMVWCGVSARPMDATATGSRWATSPRS